MSTDNWQPIHRGSPSPISTSPSRPLQRRAAPPARPHPIAGYRAQHHQYHQQHIRASGIDLNTQLHLQRALHRNQSFSRLPDRILRIILQFVLPEEIARVGRVCRRLRKLSTDEHVWKCKLDWLAYKGPLKSSTSNNAHSSAEIPSVSKYADGPLIPTTAITQNPPSDLGDNINLLGLKIVSPAPARLTTPFDQLTSSLKQADLLSFDSEPDLDPKMIAAPRRNLKKSVHPQNSHFGIPGHNKPKTSRELFIYHFTSLFPYVHSLLDHSSSCLLFTDPTLSALERAQLISTITRLLRNPFMAPKKYYKNTILARNLKNSSEIFERNLLKEFERANESGDEPAMKSIAEVVWALADGTNGAGAKGVAQIFIDQREIFYDTRFNPLDNLRRTEGSGGQMTDGLDFRPMENYIRYVLETVKRDGSMIARIFPPEAQVLLFYLERLAIDVLSEYITPLLSSVQSLPQPLFLITSVKVYTQLCEIVKTSLLIEPRNDNITSTKVEGIIHQMFEVHLGDYLDQEADWIKVVLEKICADWENGSLNMRRRTSEFGSGIEPVPGGFLASTNPVEMKQKVLSSFKSALMLPVSVVPKTVTDSINALSTAGAGALSMVTNGLMSPGAGGAVVGRMTDYQSAGFLTDGKLLGNELESWLDDTADDDGPRPSGQPGHAFSRPAPDLLPSNDFDGPSTDELNDVLTPLPSISDPLRAFISLDTSLQMIAANRESLKRIQSFHRFSGVYQAKVKHTLEKVFIVLLQTLGQKHILPAFEKAFRQMTDFKTAEGRSGAGLESNRQTKGKKKPWTMRPIHDFFELIHLADTIQQMVQVYFEQEIAEHTDVSDFLNGLVREKRTFEANLDDCVAKGLNLVIDLLINQLENLLIELQSPLDFCPVGAAEEDEECLTEADGLAPTAACRAVIRCLDGHCRLLQGSIDRHTLEVFYQEIGIRLHGILCKHLKRSIVSIDGGRQVKRDLAGYQEYLFESSVIRRFIKDNEILRTYFHSLNLVGELYSIRAPKELGKYTRELSFKISNGSLTPDELYDFVKRRADWKKIQRQVDREIYGIGKEDCSIS